MVSSEKPKAEVDVEKASKDTYLQNDIIDNLYWNKVSVDVNDKRLLDSIDGAALAGLSTLILTQCESGWTGD